MVNLEKIVAPMNAIKNKVGANKTLNNIYTFCVIKHPIATCYVLAGTLALIGHYFDNLSVETIKREIYDVAIHHDRQITTVESDEVTYKTRYPLNGTTGRVDTLFF